MTFLTLLSCHSRLHFRRRRNHLVAFNDGNRILSVKLGLRRRGNRNCFRARKDVAMTGKDAPPEVKIRSYRDSPICDVVVVVHGTGMVLRCPDYRQAMRWARVERKTYKIPEPDIDVAAKAESGDLPLFLRPDSN